MPTIHEDCFGLGMEQRRAQVCAELVLASSRSTHGVKGEAILTFQPPLQGAPLGGGAGRATPRR